MSTDHDDVMPDGNGEKGCPHCKGRGVVNADEHGWEVRNCTCVFKKDLLANVSRIWAPLADPKVAAGSAELDGSPLLSITKESAWITVSDYQLQRHLRFVALRQGLTWFARVTSDAALMTAWLSTAKEVYDADEYERRGYSDDELPSNEFQTMVDLAVPPDLLIIQLGVKVSANKEMANLLVEALQERRHAGKPTWVVDPNGVQSATNEKLPCHSQNLMSILEGFTRVEIAPPKAPSPASDPVQMDASRYRARRVVAD